MITKDTMVKSPASTPELPSWTTELDTRPRTTARPWYWDVLCRCGIHRGRWAYVAEGACKQMRPCQRCGKADIRTRHIRRWQYSWMGRCDQTKLCARCGERSGRRTRHTWGPSYTVDAGHDGHACTRCGEKQSWSTASDD